MSKQLAGWIKRILESGEKPVCRSSLHWIYLTSGAFWFATLAAMGWGADYALWHYFGQYIPRYDGNLSFAGFGLGEGWIGWLFSTCGFVIFGTQYLRYLTTTILVTSKRVITKTGLINVRVDGTDISDVRGAHVDQGWFGRFLNYGKIRLDCRFIDDVFLPYAKDPYRVTREIQQIKSRIESADNTASPMDAQHRQDASHQTIIQIHTGGAGTDIIQKDDRTLTIKPHEEPRAITHNLHDEILDDFKSKA